MKGSKNIIRLVIDKFHILVVQNISIEMYKKSVLHVQSCFFAKICYLSNGKSGNGNGEQRTGNGEYLKWGIFKSENV